MTVGQQGGITLPVGDGIGATQVVCAVRSLARAAGIPAIITVAEPIEMTPGPAGTQLASEQITD
jgi:hypothetical protein